MIVSSILTRRTEPTWITAPLVWFSAAISFETASPVSLSIPSWNRSSTWISTARRASPAASESAARLSRPVRLRYHEPIVIGDSRKSSTPHESSSSRRDPSTAGPAKASVRYICTGISDSTASRTSSSAALRRRRLLATRVPPPLPRRVIPVSVRIRCTKPYERPVDAARDRILSPESYRFLSSVASLLRSTPVTRVPFLSVSPMYITFPAADVYKHGTPNGHAPRPAADNAEVDFHLRRLEKLLKAACCCLTQGLTAVSGSYSVRDRGMNRSCDVRVLFTEVGLVGCGDLGTPPTIPLRLTRGHYHAAMNVDQHRELATPADLSPWSSCHDWGHEFAAFPCRPRRRAQGQRGHHGAVRPR